MGSLQNLDALLENFIQEDGPSPAGAGLRVYQGEDCLYERYVGYRDAENKLPFTPDTICQLASMTKCIAVTAAISVRGTLSSTSTCQSCATRIIKRTGSCSGITSNASAR